MSLFTLNESDWPREVKAPRPGSSITVLVLAVACIAAAFFWLVATMPNPVTIFEDVVIGPAVESAKAEIGLLVQRCGAEQVAVEAKTVPTTSPQCAPIAPLVEQCRAQQAVVEPKTVSTTGPNCPPIAPLIRPGAVPSQTAGP
jgi:hypothetical protein